MQNVTTTIGDPISRKFRKIYFYFYSHNQFCCDKITILRMLYYRADIKILSLPLYSLITIIDKIFELVKCVQFIFNFVKHTYKFNENF